MSHRKQLAVVLLMIGGQCMYAQEQAAAVIRELSGTVETKAAGSSVWTKAAQGDRIGKDTIISTGFKSTAIITLGNSTLTVRPLTRLSLEEIVRNGNDEQVQLRLQTGRVRADVNPPAGGTTDFTLRTPATTASVRGTSFELDTENIHVDEGTVQYSLANGRQTNVSEQENSYVDEVNRRVVSAFEAAHAALSPALPIGSAVNAASGDKAPIIGNTSAPSPVGDFGPGFDWGN
jgi:hypothetical protein